MIIYGLNPVREAVRSHPEKIGWIGVARDEKGRLARLIDEAKAAGVEVRFLVPDQLRKLAGAKVHNGVVAEVGGGAYADLDAVLDGGTAEVVFIADGIQDPQNLGAIIRVADVFGIGAVIIPQHESAGLTATVVKASSGASEWVPVARVTNLARTIEELKARGYWVYGASADGDELGAVDFRGKVAVVLGSEGSGIRRNVREHCDRVISVPMRGKVDSLNVATAAAVIAYEIDRQRKG